MACILGGATTRWGLEDRGKGLLPRRACRGPWASWRRQAEYSGKGSWGSRWGRPSDSCLPVPWWLSCLLPIASICQDCLLLAGTANDAMGMMNYTSERRGLCVWGCYYFKGRGLILETLDFCNLRRLYAVLLIYNYHQRLWAWGLMACDLLFILRDSEIRGI